METPPSCKWAQGRNAAAWEHVLCGRAHTDTVEFGTFFWRSNQQMTDGYLTQATFCYTELLSVPRVGLEVQQVA